MRRKKRLSFNDWIKINLHIDSPIENYANYHTQWHLNNAKEFVADEAEVDDVSIDNYGGNMYNYVVDKQSIHTAIDNYIEINNLNKEL